MANTNQPLTESDEAPRDEAQLDEARELGSAEFGAMTFTPPGGKTMTLDEYVEHAERQSEAEADTGSPD